MFIPLRSYLYIEEIVGSAENKGVFIIFHNFEVKNTMKIEDHKNEFLALLQEKIQSMVSCTFNTMNCLG